MGYSARYHAASLAAVFLALAVGILIGAGLGDNVVSGTEENLRESLQGDIEDARSEAADLRTQLERERAFAAAAFPALVGDTLTDRRIGLIALGELPPDVSGDVDAALEPSGGQLVEVAVARMPPDTGALTTALDSPKFAALDDDPSQLEDLGALLGTQFAVGRGGALARTRNVLFIRSSGEGGKLDGVIVVRGPQGDLQPPDQAKVDALESGLVRGLAGSGVPVVAVETSTVQDSSVGFFQPFGVTTVDSVDLSSGRVAMVFGLVGAKGSFGIKDTANSLLPELLEPSRRAGR